MTARDPRREASVRPRRRRARGRGDGATVSQPREPESFVRSALGPSVRAHVNSLRASGYEVILHEGVLDVFAPSFTSTGAELDALLKRAFATATAFGVG